MKQCYRYVDSSVELKGFGFWIETLQHAEKKTGPGFPPPECAVHVSGKPWPQSPSIFRFVFVIPSPLLSLRDLNGYRKGNVRELCLSPSTLPGPGFRPEGLGLSQDRTFGGAANRPQSVPHYRHRCNRCQVKGKAHGNCSRIAEFRNLVR